ncbi:hypothetical protein Tco_1352292 [Tanacetum coccineum]
MSTRQPTTPFSVPPLRKLVIYASFSSPFYRYFRTIFIALLRAWYQNNDRSGFVSGQKLPPLFTSTASKQENNNICFDHQQKKFSNTSPLEKELSPMKEAKEYVQPQVSRVSESSFGFSTRIPSRTPLNGGSILELLDDMIKVGQSMGYDMEGCSKDIERIIGSQGATDGVK